MRQCKICGTPLGKEPTTQQLEEHWKKHHVWHWQVNQDKTPEEALLKKNNIRSVFISDNTLNFVEFIITIFHFHTGNDIDRIIFGKKLNQNMINEDIRIFPSGGLTKNGGIQEKYLKINLKNNNDFNLELLSDFLAYRLSSIDDADSLKIGNNNVALKKDEIKKALKIHLSEI